MRVLHILKSLEKGGAERYVIDLCRELNKRKDIEYKLLILQKGNDYDFLTDEIPYIQMDGPYIPSLFRKIFFDFSKYKKIIDDFKPNIIHTHLFRSELYSSLYVPRDIVFVTHGHDNMKEFLNFNWKTLTQRALMTNFFEKQILLKKKYKKNNNTYFIANSQNTLSYFKRNVPRFLKTNVTQMDYGFDFARFVNHNKKNKSLSGKLMLINVGRFAIYKNQKLLIQIANELRNKNIDFELNLLGEGEELEEIKSLIQKHDLQESVFLRGNVNDVENWLKNADIYLHSAYYEPFGLVLLEAMAAALPCVILNGKGSADVIKNGFNGYIFNEQNPYLFVEKIIELQNDPILYKLLSENAQEYASTFEIGPKTDELITFYQSILKKNNNKKIK